LGTIRVVGGDVAGVGAGSEAQTAVVNGDPKLDRSERAFASGPGQNNFWFNPGSGCLSTAPNGPNCIFTDPAVGTFNRQRVRNLIYNPGFQNHNIGLMKDFVIKEGHKLTFRMEAFNWPNHPNWGGASGDRTSAAFGKVTTKSSERQLQFALRYQF
jgi:hypothetical protein